MQVCVGYDSSVYFNNKYSELCLMLHLATFKTKTGYLFCGIKIDIDFLKKTYGNLQSSLPVSTLWDMLTFLHDPLPRQIFNLFFVKQFP